MKPSTVLLQGAEFLRTHDWTQGAYARDKDGKAVEWSDPTAVRWSLRGAVYKALDSSGEECITAEKALHIFEVLYDRSIECFNDVQFRYKEEVIQSMIYVAEYLQRRYQ